MMMMMNQGRITPRSPHTRGDCVGVERSGAEGKLDREAQSGRWAIHLALPPPATDETVIS